MTNRQSSIRRTSSMAPHSTWSCGHHDCVSGACPAPCLAARWMAASRGARGASCVAACILACCSSEKIHPLPRQQCRRAPACSIIRSAHKPDELGSLVAVDYL
ncbi:hypothetical protein BGZ61DRAFT_436823, partial [Ilyonectria robusta]|uniref:uncharacterized protein n=1 Tax=Ilyonectria robusta TaxID=1079257 RepID=UPI001E8D1C5F